MGHSSPDLTSQDTEWNFDSYSGNHSNITRYGCHLGKPAFSFYVVTQAVASIGLPLTIVAIFAVYSLIRKDHVAPIYVINLLITDLIQLCCMIIMGQEFSKYKICQTFDYIHQFGVIVSISFMVVVSLERYLMIAWPMWYKFRRNIKTSVIVCVVVWLLPLFYLPIFFFAGDNIETTIACFLLIPFPLLIFFLAGTLKALSAARSVPADEKRRVVAILVLVLLIYTMLFLPLIVLSLSERCRRKSYCVIATVTPAYFSPLADLSLYVFLRKSICDKLLASMCRCKMEQDDVGTLMEMGDTVNSCSPAQAERDEGQKKDGAVETTGRTEMMSSPTSVQSLQYIARD